MARQREPAGMKKPPLALGQRRLLPVRNQILRHVRSRPKITRIGRESLIRQFAETVGPRDRSPAPLCCFPGRVCAARLR
jgi:hypothetical protein